MDLRVPRYFQFLLRSCWREMQRLIAYISGKVQKTGYRARVVTITQILRLKGYVQNLKDGRVKVVAEGETIDLEKQLWMRF